MELKQVRVLYPEGEWEDVRVAQELRSTPMKAVAFPRELLRGVRQEGKKRASVLPNLEVPGVYLLVGRSEGKGSNALVYIGQTIRRVGNRLAQHDTKNTYPWWTDTIAFIKESKDLHDGLISHVESSLVGSVGVNPRWKNQQNSPSKNAGNLSPEDLLLWRDLVPNVKKIIGALGWDIFSNFASEMSLSTVNQVTLPSTPDIPMFEGERKGYRARMYVVDSEEFVIEKGSTAWARSLKTIRRSIDRERRALIKEGLLRKAAGELLEFTKNHTFKSAWKAASVISGGPVDGDRFWKTPDGETYGEWKKRNSRNEGNAEIEPVNPNEQTDEVKWKSPEFAYSERNASATMQINSLGKYVVKKKSKASEKTAPSTDESVKETGQNLLDQGVLNKDFVFTKDYDFSSARMSASVVRGHNKNGNDAWKLPDGRTLGQWLSEQKSNSEEDDIKSKS